MTASQSICIGDHRRTSSGKGGGDIGEDGMGDEHLVGDTAGNADIGNGGTGSLLIFGVGEGGMKRPGARNSGGGGGGEGGDGSGLSRL